MKQYKIFILIFLSFCNLVFCQLTGKIVGISDGDTVTLLDNSNVQHKIRLWGIDAPEKKQDYGAKAKEHLSDLIFGEYVHVTSKGKDRYGRILGIIYLENPSVDKDGHLSLEMININYEMVKSGFAWKYKYTSSKELQKLQQEAKDKKKGLWNSSNPMNPIEFRKLKAKK